MFEFEEERECEGFFPIVAVAAALAKAPHEDRVNVRQFEIPSGPAQVPKNVEDVVAILKDGQSLLKPGIILVFGQAPENHRLGFQRDEEWFNAALGIAWRRQTGGRRNILQGDVPEPGGQEWGEYKAVSAKL
jgi:hypothetical protein